MDVNAVRGCPSTSRVGRASRLGWEEEVSARVFHVVPCRRVCAPSPTPHIYRAH
jgi:hypothetical protein